MIDHSCKAFSRFPGWFKVHTCGQENEAGDGLGIGPVYMYMCVHMATTDYTTSTTMHRPPGGTPGGKLTFSAAFGSASQQLLANYSMTPGATPGVFRTPRTPAHEDTILQEAQNIIALQNVQTPLKGGENVPLHETSFEGITPRKQTVQTPNVVLGTPFRTPSQVGPGSTPKMLMQSPHSAGVAPAFGGMTPGQTPVRDQLSINPDDAL